MILTVKMEETLRESDRFFCGLVNLIPGEFYFPTDEEENWIRSNPRKAKKYLKNVSSGAPKQLIKEESKKGQKRSKFDPKAEQTNVEKQQQSEEQEEKQQKKNHKKITSAPAGSIEELRNRLNVRISQMREKRIAHEQKQKQSDPSSANKKRKLSSDNNKQPKKKQQPTPKKKQPKPQQQATPTKTSTPPPPPAKSTSTTPTKTTDANTNNKNDDISYGSLLIGKSTSSLTNSAIKKARHGKKSLKGMQQLLKKAEQNEQRIAKLKETEEGKELVKKKGLTKALKQAAGEKVMDDPKMLRKAIKKKEKAKVKSATEWTQRLATQEKDKKDRINQKIQNRIKKGKANKVDAPPSSRAGFEGKKGESFLNKKKKKE